MFQRRPTRAQLIMIVLLGIALAAIIVWAVVEFAGIFSGEAEQTFSEWVFDLDLWAILVIGAIQILVGVAAVWSAGHYLEGYARRRRIEKRTRSWVAGETLTAAEMNQKVRDELDDSL